MELVYNIDYDIAALLVLAIILIYLFIQYSSTLESNRCFRGLTICALLLTVSDIASAFVISYGSQIPLIVNKLVNASYYGTEAISIFLFSNYVKSYYNHIYGKAVHFLTNRVPIIFYAVILLINFFTPTLFEVSDQGAFSHGPVHFFVYVIPIYYYILSMVVMFIHRKEYPFKRLISMMTFVIISISTMLIQTFVLPEYLLSCFGAAVSILIMLIALETPDYQKLVKTMEQLKKAEAEAQAANVAKSTFLANMSHEIRTPINGVLGMNEIILKSNPSPDILECANNIEASGRSLLAIINDILDLSKIESGKIEISPIRYSITIIMNNVYQMIFFRAQNKHLALNVHCNKDIPIGLLGDEIRIRQIMTNLLTNAVKYTMEGSIDWNVDYEPIDDENIMLCISVKDTGIGIKKEDISELFVAFKRAEEQAHRTIEGTGLGLRITKQLVELMGGTINVESEYGKGSVFTVKIPQKILNAAPSGEFKSLTVTHIEEDSKDVRDMSAYTILVVDDVLVNIKVIRGLLRETKINIDSAGSGREALDYLFKNKYDLVFLDHLMPEMDGVETLKELKKVENGLNKDTPIIMLTANAILGAREEYLEAGFTDYLTKPVRGKSLIDTLNKYIQ